MRRLASATFAAAFALESCMRPEYPWRMSRASSSS
eukprot:CAMPEP_0198559012 /NCGR_PEP_ID=MMETSP1462-20131121/91551_1 /TAXON_ID=1333877 /ORGANISM="Brandtodinium nutriculum, Strain RCC3387" /LENGTH=34 /DNA_ID= /DNA_START= /DNA_END= /DNA_ORIENTATION=